MEQPALQIRRIFRSARTVAQFGEDLLGKSAKLRAFTEEIGLVRREVVHKNGELFLPLSVIAEEVVVLLEGLEPMLLKPPGKPAFKKELGSIVKKYPAVAVDKITKEPEHIVRQRNGLLFKHLSPQCLFRRLPYRRIRISVGNFRKDRLDRRISPALERLDRGLPHAPVRVRQSCYHGP